MTCFVYIYIVCVCIIFCVIFVRLSVSRWTVECLHVGWSWQQSRDRPGTQPLTFVQSEPSVTVGSSQSDRWARLAQPLPPGDYLLQKHTR